MHRFFCQFILHNRPISSVQLHLKKNPDKSVYLIVVPLYLKVYDTLSNIWLIFFTSFLGVNPHRLNIWGKMMFFFLKLKFIKYSSLVTGDPMPIDNHWKYLIYFEKNPTSFAVDMIQASCFMCINLETSPWTQHFFFNVF